MLHNETKCLSSVVGLTVVSLPRLTSTVRLGSSRRRNYEAGCSGKMASTPSWIKTESLGRTPRRPCRIESASTTAISMATSTPTTGCTVVLSEARRASMSAWWSLSFLLLCVVLPLTCKQTKQTMFLPRPAYLLQYVTTQVSYYSMLPPRLVITVCYYPG